MSATLAAVTTTVWTSLLSRSAPMCAFIPKYHCWPLRVWCISGSRCFSWFLVEGGAATGFVGMGEEVPFERGGQGVEIADERGVAGGFQEFGGGEEAELLNGGGDFEQVAALRDGELVVEDIAARDAAHHFHGAGGAVEAVLAGLEDALPAGDAGQQEIPVGAHHAGLRQSVGDTSSAGAAGEFDEGFVAETLIRPLQPVDGEAAGRCSREHKEAERAQQAHRAAHRESR